MESQSGEGMLLKIYRERLTGEARTPIFGYSGEESPVSSPSDNGAGSTPGDNPQTRGDSGDRPCLPYSSPDPVSGWLPRMLALNRTKRTPHLDDAVWLGEKVFPFSSDSQPGVQVQRCLPGWDLSERTRLVRPRCPQGTILRSVGKSEPFNSDGILGLEERYSFHSPPGSPQRD